MQQQHSYQTVDSCMQTPLTAACKLLTSSSIRAVVCNPRKQANVSGSGSRKASKNSRPSAPNRSQILIQLAMVEVGWFVGWLVWLVWVLIFENSVELYVLDETALHALLHVALKVLLR
jgi:hypothetical protein